MEPHTVRPRRFDQAQEVADHFKSDQILFIPLSLLVCFLILFLLESLSRFYLLLVFR